ncbi:MAG: tetratricopeptide repeat protein [bacterium]|nr:tetratricopeptide repeat protein [bacterium]
MRRLTPFISLILPLLAVSWAAPLAAQGEGSAMERAAGLVANDDWAGAADAYQAITESEPDNAGAWFGLGRSQFESRRVDRAIAAFEKALELGFDPARSMLHLARCHAAQGGDEEAIGWIRKAAETGASIHQALETTAEFKRLEENAEFREILDQIRPCNTPAHRQLDFWIGSWRVVTGEDEQRVGTNSIQKILNGCGVIENWRGANGTEGKSLFYYHDVEKTWKQVWITDSQGLKEKHLIAVLDGAVRFQGEIRLADGTTVLDRTTLLPVSENRVRQVIQQSVDGGETWQTGFDAMYVRDGAE